MTEENPPKRVGEQSLHIIPLGTLLPLKLKASTKSSKGAVTSTGQTLNESELQLYRVLQRANLLSYYDTFIAQGGDDVQQLCEAGEEEFLEIMALVGMSAKPLHVRRLQKVLQDWIKNPGLFSLPFGPLCTFPSPLRGVGPPVITTPTTTPPPLRSGGVDSPIPSLSSSSQASSPPPSLPLLTSSANGISLSQNSAPSSPGSRENNLVSSPISGSNSPTNSQNGNSSGDYPPQPISPHPQNPVLSEYQIQKISQIADLIVKSLPPSFQPKLPNKKKITKELEIKNYVLSMSDDDPKKMEEIRKFSAIYGRFDCKRRPQKPLTLHEVSVNEASAQLCSKLPALLVRRDELFPLARQVVRDSGYQYSKGHSRSQFSTGFPSKLFGGCISSVADKTNNGSSSVSNGNEIEAKKIKMDPSESDSEMKMKDSWDDEEVSRINQKMSELQKASNEANESGDLSHLHSINQQLDILQSKQAQLFQQEAQEEYSRFISFNSRHSGNSSEGEKTDDDSCQGGVDPLVNNSSSSINLVSNILSTSGGQIIAVQNPALFIRNQGRESSSPVSSIIPSPNNTSIHSISTRDSPPKRRRKSSKSSPSSVSSSSSCNGLNLRESL
ncbi:NGFI-A-binding protein 1 isoform X2 [Lepeophtheirus salmonis]|uniref:NGFI-A-binding protein 1 isoform X2 n=1 Tax=Lepeophtheirus salmonis TaxID=72036 RepID=UPI001AE84582|nr:NGFI-A-binding protein homolog isoform X3 [Lepeophtheirus salmonis]